MCPAVVLRSSVSVAAQASVVVPGVVLPVLAPVLLRWCGSGPTVRWQAGPTIRVDGGGGRPEVSGPPLRSSAFSLGLAVAVVVLPILWLFFYCRGPPAVLGDRVCPVFFRMLSLLLLLTLSAPS